MLKTVSQFSAGQGCQQICWLYLVLKTYLTGSEIDAIGLLFSFKKCLRNVLLTWPTVTGFWEDQEKQTAKSEDEFQVCSSCWGLELYQLPDRIHLSLFECLEAAYARQLVIRTFFCSQREWGSPFRRGLRRCLLLPHKGDFLAPCHCNRRKAGLCFRRRWQQASPLWPCSCAGLVAHSCSWLLCQCDFWVVSYGRWNFNSKIHCPHLGKMQVHAKTCEFTDFYFCQQCSWSVCMYIFFPEEHENMLPQSQLQKCRGAV